MDRAELISLGVRLATAAAITFFSVRYMIKYVDPSYASREENKKKVAELFAQLGLEENDKVELNEHELRIALQLVGDDAGVEWSEIGGAEELISQLKERVILPLRLSGMTTSSLLSPPRGILLYGPPGCGKTLIAKAVAKASNCRFINLQVSNLTDKWYGESQKLAAAVFSVAQKLQPTIIFIDEIDSFLRDRQSHDHEATAMMKAQFMQLWDGFATSKDQVIVMGATNRPDDLDGAILRRMPAKFAVPVPNQKQRHDIIKVILKNEHLASDVNLAVVAEQADGLSGSDLKEVCRLSVLRRAQQTLSKLSASSSLSCGDDSRRLVAAAGGLPNDPISQDDLVHALLDYARSTGSMANFALD